MMNAKEANTRAKEVIKERSENKTKKIMDYINSTLESEIKEASENGKFSCLVNIPLDFDRAETKKLIESFGYSAMRLHSNTFEIGWRIV